jgi:hypothetical protein
LGSVIITIVSFGSDVFGVRFVPTHLGVYQIGFVNQFYNAWKVIYELTHPFLQPFVSLLEGRATKNTVRVIQPYIGNYKFILIQALNAQ